MAKEEISRFEDISIQTPQIKSSEKKRVQKKKSLLQRCNIMEMLEEERDKRTEEIS